jgi:cytochrome b subunit of formate dehydrogenase
MTEQTAPSPEQRPPQDSTLAFVRLNTHERLQHMIFIVCFVLLVITGFTLRLPDTWMRRLAATPFSYEVRSNLHRGAGIALIIVSLIHIYYLVLFKEGRAWVRDIFLRPRDLREAVQTVAYNLRLRKELPRYDWALIVGNTLMSITGLMLVFEYLWGQLALDIAGLIHRMEAILACLALIVWHMYEVHLRPSKFPHSAVWWHGLMTEEEMREEHPAHLERLLKTGESEAPRIRIHEER